MTLAIETIDLSKTYDEVKAVQHLNMSVKTGESVGFLGPNGAGKTTTIQMLLNLIKPTDGSIRLFDEDMRGKERELLKNVGALVSMPGYYRKLTPEDYLRYVTKVFKMPQQDATRRIHDVLRQVGLEDARFRAMGNFSTGMKRRLGIAQILVHDPEIIILDEPTNGLDPKGVREIRDLINRINDTGKTVFMTTHNLTEVDEISERVIFLNHGEKIGDESLKDIRHRLGSQQIEVKFIDEVTNSQKSEIEHIEHVREIYQADKFFVKYEGGANEAYQILQDLLALKLPVYSYQPTTMTLEDIYLKLYSSPAPTGISSNPEEIAA